MSAKNANDAKVGAARRFTCTRRWSGEYLLPQCSPGLLWSRSTSRENS